MQKIGNEWYEVFTGIDGMTSVALFGGGGGDGSAPSQGTTASENGVNAESTTPNTELDLSCIDPRSTLGKMILQRCSHACAAATLANAALVLGVYSDTYVAYERIYNSRCCGQEWESGVDSHELIELAGNNGMIVEQMDGKSIVEDIMVELMKGCPVLVSMDIQMDGKFMNQKEMIKTMEDGKSHTVNSHLFLLYGGSMISWNWQCFDTFDPLDRKYLNGCTRDEKESYYKMMDKFNMVDSKQQLRFFRIRAK
jgi:hypothetical protein